LSEADSADVELDEKLDDSNQLSEFPCAILAAILRQSSLQLFPFAGECSGHGNIPTIFKNGKPSISIGHFQ
jgi:hypothetical protein